ncbi:hypothetical protein [Halorussus halobius]|uniref:hypothetical protein n=1 Tax=Halorussus halobius TaxID=1710537 RepID=UPI00109294D3|nr:hypothetical protein [Halorussus halobius]
MSDGTAERLDRLESLVAEQRALIERQRDRIGSLEADTDGIDAPLLANRRNALKAGGLLALLFGGVGTASADAQGRVGTSGDPLDALYAEELNGGVTDDSAMTNLLGNGLALSGNALTADLGNGLGFDGSNRVTVELSRQGSGTALLSDVTTDGVEHRSVSGADGISVTESDGTVSIGSTPTTTETISSFTSGDLASSSNVIISDGNLEGGSGQSSTADRLPDGGTFSNQNGLRSGIEIEPQTDLTRISVMISTNTSGESTVYLVDTDLDTITQEPSPGAGNSVTLTADLSAGTKYGILVDAQDGGDRSDASFPFTSQYVDITNGAYDQAGTYANIEDAICVRKVTGFPPPGGEATIEWPDVTPVSCWETATFQTVQTGGSVEVYVETDDGSGWSTWGSHPVGPGTDLSSIPGDSRVRFRVEFTGSQESGTPKLTLASRQYRP